MDSKVERSARISAEKSIEATRTKATRARAARRHTRAGVLVLVRRTSAPPHLRQRRQRLQRRFVLPDDQWYRTAHVCDDN
jgi:hypothetical protein